MQNHYNLVYREEEREMMPLLKVGSILRSCFYIHLLLRCIAPRGRIYSLVSSSSRACNTAIQPSPKHCPKLV